MTYERSANNGLNVTEEWSGSDIRGTIGWNSNIANTGTCGVVSVITDSAHTGCLGLSTQANALGRASIYCADGNGVGVGTFFNFNTFSFKWVIKLSALSVLITDEYFVKIGVASTVANLIENTLHGVVFSYNLTQSANWQIVATNNGVETRITSSIPVSTNWVTLELRRVDNTYVAYIDGASVGSFTTSQIPPPTVSVGLHARINKMTGTSNRTLYVDSCRRVMA